MAGISNTAYSEDVLEDIDELISRDLQPDNYNIQGDGDILDQPFLGVQPLPNVNQELHVNVLDLKEIYDKVQKKTASGSEQRIAHGVVNIEIITAAQVSKVNVYVRRCETAAERTNDTIGPVELPVKDLRCSSDKIYFHVDLDAVYKTDNGRFIYWLDRVDVDERNIWELLIVTEFIDETSKISQSKPFRIRTKPRASPKVTEQSPASTTTSPENIGDKENEPLLAPVSKRKRASPSVSSYGTTPSPFSPYSPFTGGSDYSHGPSSNQSNQPSEAVVTDYLEAQRAQIQHLRVHKMISSNADIAYHLNLQGPPYRDQKLEEGDVVGFFEDKSTGQTEIALLSMDNIQEARMAGVISRSAYLHGNVPKSDSGPTDTVCVIGIVHVKVAGPVQNGERIYASTGKPGIGIPETQMPLRAPGNRSPILLGQSLEAAHASTLDTVKSVKCFVSVVLGIQSEQVYTALEDVRRDTRIRISESIKREKRKFLKTLLRRAAVISIILAIVTAVLYELLVPGTWLRYAICKRGSIDGHDAWFTYTTHDMQTPRVHGVEFEWNKLRKKMDLHFSKYNETGSHYYLNLDRCAYGGIVSVSSHLDKTPQVRGPEIFAVDPSCSHAYYEMNGKWYVYTSGRDFKCVPSYEVRK